MLAATLGKRCDGMHPHAVCSGTTAKTTTYYTPTLVKKIGRTVLHSFDGDGDTSQSSGGDARTPARLPACGPDGRATPARSVPRKRALCVVDDERPGTNKMCPVAEASNVGDHAFVSSRTRPSEP
eukprot:9084021-Heterocapsa_arctica.AAC.1